jgi:two-component system LytT family sensor kinase
MRNSITKSIEFTIHLLIWGGLFILVFLLAQNLGGFKKEDGSIYIPLIYGLLTNLILFYLNAYFLIPKYLPAKKIKAYVIWVLSLFCGITLIESILDHFIFINLYSTENEPFGAQIILNTIINGLILSLSIGYGFIKNWIINENQKQKLVKEKLSAELNYLKAQINPHFLFNTLNMAYASALKHGDVDTSDIIEKLSGLLRYNLYECEGTKVDLEKELNYLENYINLQSKRLSEDIKQYLKIHIDKPESHYKIAPLLLMPIIENVFKHGILLSNQGEIEINVSIQNNKLKLFTKNPLVLNKIKSDYSGIGNRNTKARLDLLYKNMYSLTTKTEDNSYITELSIQL